MVIIVRYNEIALKGKNRFLFEKALARNIRWTMREQGIEYERVMRPHGRLIIYTEGKPNLSKVFGVASYSYAIETESEVSAISNILAGKIGQLTGTFRVSCQRIDKRVPLRSMDVEREVGQFVVDNTDMKVKLKGYDHEVGIDILDGRAYVYIDRMQGPKGLPVGVMGLLGLLVKDRLSLLTGILLLKRGLAVQPFCIDSCGIDVGVLKEYGAREVMVVETLRDVEELDPIAIGVSDTVESIEEYETDRLVLRPLAGLPREYIEGLGSEYGI